MGERDPTELLLERVRRIGPPSGAAERVLSAVDERRRAPRFPRPTFRVFLPALGLGAVAVAVLALLAPIRRGAPATPPRPIDRGWAVAGDGASPSARGTASVAPERQATLLGPTGKVLLDGPARARWKGDRLALLGGSGRVTGRATVEGAGGCRVCVDGAADVAVEAEMLAVTILAGTVEVESGGTACRVIERHPPAPEGDTQVTSAEQGREPGDPVPGAGSVRPAPEEPSPSAGPATAFDEIGGESPEAGASELARQLQAYDAAMALRGVADARALAAWRRFARRWPSSPMLHEVLLNEVDALERLGRGVAARRAARRFLRRFPDSPWSGEMRRIVASESVEAPEAR